MHTYCVWIIGLLSITSYVCDIGSSELTSDHRLQYKESLTRGEDAMSWKAVLKRKKIIICKKE